MPLNVADRVRETTTTTGTGTITLAGAVTGYQSFSVIGNGNTTYYTINAGSQWEVGIGTYLGAGPTLSRDTVLESSNANALVNFSAGTKAVFVTYPAEKSVYQDGSAINAGSAVLGIANGGTSATTAGAALTALGAYPASNPNGYLSTVSLTTNVTGTLPVANGGTGATTLTSGYLVKGNGASAVSASVVYDNGTNVGIGTASPASPLDVATNSSALGIAIRGRASDNVGSLALRSNDGATIYGQVQGRSTDFRLEAGSSNIISAYTNSAERMRIDASGNVGIGTSSPDTRLHVSSTGTYPFKVSGGANAISTFTDGTIVAKIQTSGAVRMGAESNHAFALITNDTERMRIGASGNVLVGTTSIGVSGNANTILSLANGNTDVYTSIKSSSGPELISGATPVECFSGTFTSSPYVIRTNNSERMQITAAGLVGIGLTPAHLFSVKAATDGVNSLIAGATKAVRVNHTTTETRLEGVSQDGTTFQPLQIGGSFVTISESGTEVARFTGGNLALGTTNTTAISGYTSLKINNGTNGAILDLAQGDTYRGRLVGTASALAIETNTGLPIVFSPAGVERMRIDSSGNLLVGNTTGTSKVTVTGVVESTTGGFKFPDGTTQTTASTSTGTVTSVGGTGTVNGITLTGSVTTSGSLTLGGTLSGVSLTTQVSGTLPVANGGTGVTTSTGTGNVVLSTSPALSKAILNDGYTEEVFAITDGTVSLDPNNGSIQTWTLGASRTPNQTNWAAGQSITLMIDDGSARTITWTTLGVVWETNGGVAPTLATSGFTVIVLWKVGTTIYGARVGDA